jgi:hypothetical protein
MFNAGSLQLAMTPDKPVLARDSQQRSAGGPQNQA